jgi:hypothetical protein
LLRHHIHLQLFSCMLYLYSRNRITSTQHFTHLYHTLLLLFIINKLQQFVTFCYNHLYMSTFDSILVF